MNPENNQSEVMEYLLDRMAIQDTLIRFATAMDTKQLDLLDKVFLPDADIDYGEYWGPGDLEGFTLWAEASLAHFAACQHLLSNFVIDIDGDTATARTEFYNPIFTEKGNARKLSQAYGHYSDRLLRAPSGWLIQQRKMTPLLGLEPDSIK